MCEQSNSVWKVLSNCCICDKKLSEYSSPQLLPCCHSSCKDCIVNNLRTLTNRESTDNSEFKCKVCSQEYLPEECIDNFFQLIYWKQSQKNETQICQSCEGQKSAVIKCKTCDWICDDCQTLHNTIKIFKSHELDPTTKSTPTTDITNAFCSAHNGELTIYCKTCLTSYCSRCILKDHKSHVYEDIRDENQLKIFYNKFNKKIETIKEKRNFTENTLKMFEAIESEISQQRKQCITQIETIVGKLQEKISQFGTTLINRVNIVCNKKEQDFNDKKNELRQYKVSSEYFEEFMANILPPGPINQPMALMKAQHLLNNQLERLLNMKCNNPDFIKPFKIQVINDFTEEHKDFDVEKIIDGVFNMCFKIVTSDDYKQSDKTIANNLLKDAVTRIDGQNQLLASILRGNSRPSSNIPTYKPPNSNRLINNSFHQNNIYNSNNHYYNYLNSIPNQMQSPSVSDPSLSAQPINCMLPANIQCFQKTMQYYANMRNSMSSTESVPQMPNNFMGKTGFQTNGQYGSRQVYRPQQVAVQNNYYPPNITIPLNTSNQITSVAVNNQQNCRNSYDQTHYTQIPTSVRQALNHSYNPHISETRVQTAGIYVPTVMNPMSLLQSNGRTIRPQIIAAKKQKNRTSDGPKSQSVVPRVVTQAVAQAVRQRKLKNKQQKINDRIRKDLQTTSQPVLNYPLDNMRLIIKNISQTKTSSTETQSSNANESNGPANRAVTDRSYQFHIPEDTVIIPLNGLQSETRQSINSEQQRQQSVSTTTTVVSVVETNQNQISPASSSDGEEYILPIANPPPSLFPETQSSNANKSNGSADPAVTAPDCNHQLQIIENAVIIQLSEMQSVRRQLKDSGLQRQESPSINKIDSSEGSSTKKSKSNDFSV